MSLWLRDIPVSPEHRVRLQQRKREAIERRAAAVRGNRLAEARIRRQAVEEVGAVSDRDLFIAGVVLYAAEGTKQKPWNTAAATEFINSDPRVITLFLRWLDLLGIPREDLRFRVLIHETADVDAAMRSWADLAGVEETAFLRPTLKRGNPRTRRRNVGQSYRGCLVVTVRRSVDLTRRIEGWFDAVAAAPNHGHVRSPTPTPSLGRAP